jgi:hypothetical protein
VAEPKYGVCQCNNFSERKEQVKLNFSTKINDNDLKNTIIKNFPTANISHISRSGETGTVEITGVDEALKNNIQNTINSHASSIPDIQLKCEVKKVFNKEEVKAMKRIEIDDDDDLSPSMDFNSMLNQQMNFHIKKAKKTINVLLTEVIEEFNRNTGSFSTELDTIKRNIIASSTDSENNIVKLKNDFDDLKEDITRKLSSLEGRFDELDNLIEKGIDLLKRKGK